MLGRKIAASCARRSSSAYFEVNAAAHYWRAVVLPGMVVVPELAGKPLVVREPRPRASGQEAREGWVDRAELAGGSGGETVAELGARND